MMMRLMIVGLVMLLAAQGAVAQAVDTAAGPPIDLSRYTGVARPRHEVVIAAPVDGRLGSIAVKENARVEADTLLASMDDRVQSAVVAVAELQAGNDAPVDSAREQVRYYQIELERLEELTGSGAANPQEVRLAKVRLAQAQADLKNAEAQMDQARSSLVLERQRLDQLHLRAPFDGVVLQLSVDPGGTLRVADPILRLAQMDVLEAKVPLPAHLYDALETGRTYTLHASAPINADISAVLARRTPEIDPASDTFLATFEIDNQDQVLPTGFRVYLRELGEQARR